MTSAPTKKKGPLNHGTESELIGFYQEWVESNEVRILFTLKFDQNVNKMIDFQFQCYNTSPLCHMICRYYERRQ